MPPDLLLILALVGLGGLVTIDSTSIGQLMISRPIVAATLGGALVGSPTFGIYIGVVLEAFHLTVLPVGAAKYPESAAPAVVGGGGYALAGGGMAELVTVLVFVLAWEWVSGESVRPLRYLNIRLRPDPADPRFGPGLVQRRHWLAIGLDLLRGMVITGVGLALLLPILRFIRPYYGPADWVAWMAIGAAAAAALAATIRMFGFERLRYFLGGAALGVVVLWIW